MADWGGVFSPSMLCGGLLKEGLIFDMSLFAGSRLGVGVADRLVVSFSGDLSGDFSGGFASNMKSLKCGLDGRVECFSGDFGELFNEPPSRKLLKSLTCPVCRDCIRL